MQELEQKTNPPDQPSVAEPQVEEQKETGLNGLLMQASATMDPGMQALLEGIIKENERQRQENERQKAEIDQLKQENKAIKRQYLTTSDITTEIKKGNLDYVKWYLEENLDISVSVQVIHSAAKIGQMAIIKLCLQQNPELINARDKNGDTPLSWAAYSGHHDTVAYLLKSGACYQKDNRGKTPLWQSKYRSKIAECFFEEAENYPAIQDTLQADLADSKDLREKFFDYHCKKYQEKHTVEREINQPEIDTLQRIMKCLDGEINHSAAAFLLKKINRCDRNPGEICVVIKTAIVLSELFPFSRETEQQLILLIVELSGQSTVQGEESDDEKADSAEPGEVAVNKNNALSMFAGSMNLFSTPKTQPSPATPPARAATTTVTAPEVGGGNHEETGFGAVELVEGASAPVVEVVNKSTLNGQSGPT